MGNWFKKSQNINPEDSFEEPEEPVQQEVRYRVMFPIDIFIASTGNPEQDQEAVYNMVKTMLNEGMQKAQLVPGFEGWTDYLQYSDIKTHDQVMKEEGLGGWG